MQTRSRSAAGRCFPLRPAPLRPSRHRRHGHVLLYFGMIVFAIMGVAALVIDVGAALLTQREMQTAADSAALSGLRFRDDVPAAWRVNPPAVVLNQCGTPPTYAPTNPSWQQWCDCARRVAASQDVSVTFDDDLNLTDGDPRQFGAGPIIDFTGGVGDPSLVASQTITLPSPPVYKPRLQANLSNAQAGDLVAGSYQTVVGSESSNYTRTDFTPAAQGPDATAPSFLARLRRTNNTGGLDDTPGTSSGGPTVPFLFGRGSVLARTSTNSDQITVQSGVTVRATAIADSRPALVAGPAYPDNLPLGSGAPPIAGTTPFALQVSQWNAVVGSASAVTFVVDSFGNLGGSSGGGQLTAVTTLDADAGNSITVDAWPGFPATPFTVLVDREIMQVTAATASSGSSLTWQVTRGIGGTPQMTHSASTPVMLHQARVIGEAVIPQTLSSPPPVPLLANLAVQQPQLASSPQPPIVAYVPLYEAINSVTRVVGYGYVQWSAVLTSGGANAGQTQITVVPYAGMVASENAAGKLVIPLTDLADAAALLTANGQDAQTPLLAPVLVNY